jgi:hypothetical protein
LLLDLGTLWVGVLLYLQASESLVRVVLLSCAVVAQTIPPADGLWLKALVHVVVMPET